MKIIKIIAWIIGVILLICIAIIIFLYKGDLTKEKLADRYISDTSKFMMLSNGATVHYRDEGNREGKTLVMLHGGFGSLHNFESLVEELETEYRLISLDLLGHGLTGSYEKEMYTRIEQRDTVYELLESLDVLSYYMVGNSFGGGIALEFVLEYPEKVDGLILIDSEGLPNTPDGYDASMFMDERKITPPSNPNFTKLSLIERLSSKLISDTIIEMTLDSMVYNKELITDDFVSYFGDIIRYNGNREAQILMMSQGLYYISTLGKMDLLDRLAEICCPTLIINGENDDLVPTRVAEMFHENIKNSELTIIQEAGHLPMIEKPKEIAELLKEFIL